MGHAANLLTPIAVFVWSSAGCFLLTILVGVWAAHDLPTALARAILIVGGLLILFGIGWAGRERARTVLSRVSLGCALLAAGIGIAYFSSLLSNSGMVSSSIMVLVPLSVSGVWWHWFNEKRQPARIGAGALVIASLALVWSLERTAWVGLAAGVLCAAYLFWRSDRTVYRGLWLFWDVAGAVCILIGVVIYWQLLVNPSVDPFLPSNRIVDDLVVKRLPLWRDTLALIQDYPFTGSGLGGAPMVYSTYVYLLHVPYFYHAHAVPLQIAVETGVPGLIALAGVCIPLLVSLVTQYEQVTPGYRLFHSTTIAAAVAALVYGLLDAELYATVAAPIFFLPWGFALALHWAFHQRSHRAARRQSGGGRSSSTSPLLGIAGLAPLLAIIAIFVLPGTLARLHHNLGAVMQTKAELSIYQWPAWPIQDEVRRSEVVNLSPAIRHFEAAIAHNREDVTAHLRLGQIALSKGKYERARGHLEFAYTIAPSRQTVRQLLAETYAVLGESNRSVALWDTISDREETLKVRLWWYKHIGAEQAVLQLKQAIQMAEVDP